MPLDARPTDVLPASTLPSLHLLYTIDSVIGKLRISLQDRFMKAMVSPKFSYNYATFKKMYISFIYLHFYFSGVVSSVKKNDIPESPAQSKQCAYRLFTDSIR